MTPFFCPYCGEEDLRPNESAHGAWECRGCARVFGVRFVGMLAVQTFVDVRHNSESTLSGRGPGRGQEETR
jgi:ribosomal protein L37AE/L43A